MWTENWKLIKSHKNIHIINQVSVGSSRDKVRLLATQERKIKTIKLNLKCELDSFYSLIMATLLYTIFSFTAGASLHCAVRPEISPCTCAPHNIYANTISVTCEKMESFNHVVNVLQNKFTPDFQIWLRITHSQMLDFDTRQFAEMNMNIKNLRLNFNNLR